ncbi:hypothetical protein GGX14DRAFT_574792 [Mycena pura]|uniref:Uncharacterized protein n=1 Tax=Mycena pura TaxID=153505 RepID=A0AAD6Y2T9_9AGAR|nr:hypothetical protein GGX14DRAFT_574792 [Mycena pura]
MAYFISDRLALPHCLLWCYPHAPLPGPVTPRALGVPRQRTAHRATRVTTSGRSSLRTTTRCWPSRAHAPSRPRDGDALVHLLDMPDEVVQRSSGIFETTPLRSRGAVLPEPTGIYSGLLVPVQSGTDITDGVDDAGVCGVPAAAAVRKVTFPTQGRYVGMAYDAQECGAINPLHNTARSGAWHPYVPQHAHVNHAIPVLDAVQVLEGLAHDVFHCDIDAHAARVRLRTRARMGAYPLLRVSSILPFAPSAPTVTRSCACMAPQVFGIPDGCLTTTHQVLDAYGRTLRCACALQTRQLARIPQECDCSAGQWTRSAGS